METLKSQVFKLNPYDYLLVLRMQEHELVRLYELCRQRVESGQVYQYADIENKLIELLEPCMQSNRDKFCSLWIAEEEEEEEAANGKQ